MIETILLTGLDVLRKHLLEHIKDMNLWRDFLEQERDYEADTIQTKYLIFLFFHREYCEFVFELIKKLTNSMLWTCGHYNRTERRKNLFHCHLKSNWNISLKLSTTKINDSKHYLKRTKKKNGKRKTKKNETKRTKETKTLKEQCLKSLHIECFLVQHKNCNDEQCSRMCDL